MEMIQVDFLEIFAQLPGRKSTGPSEFNFFYIFSTELFEFSFNPRCKIGWPTGHSAGAGEELIPKPAVFQIDRHLTTEYIFIGCLQILHFVSKYFSVQYLWAYLIPQYDVLKICSDLVQSYIACYIPIIIVTFVF